MIELFAYTILAIFVVAIVALLLFMAFFILMLIAAPFIGLYAMLTGKN